MSGRLSVCAEFRSLFHSQVKVVGPGSNPVAGEPVYVFASGSQNLTLMTDAKGMAAFSFDTALWTDTVTLTVGRRSGKRFQQLFRLFQ